MDKGRIYQFVRYCCSFNGIREGTAEHKQIIDTYNRIRPLPSGYVKADFVVPEEADFIGEDWDSIVSILEAGVIYG